MDTKLYETWVKSHQIEPADLDIADSVMERIAQKACQPDILRRTWEIILLDWIGTQKWIQMCMFVLGALAGVVRIVLQIYSLLFV